MGKGKPGQCLRIHRETIQGENGKGNKLSGEGMGLEVLSELNRFEITIADHRKTGWLDVQF